MSRWTRDATMLTRRAPNAQVVRIGALSTQGPVTEEDREVADAAGNLRLDRVTVALVPTDAFTTLARSSVVYVGTGVDRVTYALRDFRRVDDGVLTELYLARAVA